MTRDKAEDAGGLTPVKDGNTAMRTLTSELLPGILMIAIRTSPGLLCGPGAEAFLHIFGQGAFARRALYKDPEFVIYYEKKWGKSGMQPQVYTQSTQTQPRLARVAGFAWV